jgi:predicted CoA-substrate-specific enzyme activase
VICVGIDSGSRSVKVVLIESESLAVLARCQADQGIDQARIGRELLDSALAEFGCDRATIGRIIATGYGRNNIDFAHANITEITCHAAGVLHLCPQARGIIDIGGQDSKFIRLGPDSIIQDFAMNDRCAAGTGCFLEIVAAKLKCSLGQFGDLAARSTKPAAISSMCVVFAETEIIGLLTQSAAPADIAAGVQHSIASRISAMAGRNVPEPVILTGGVALVPGMDRALSTVLAKPVSLAPRPQFTGALGAALIAARQFKNPQTQFPGVIK